jgi:hypothetical protein
MLRPVIAYQIIPCNSGFWLPNIPRGWWSRFVRAPNILRAGLLPREKSSPPSPSTPTTVPDANRRVDGIHPPVAIPGRPTRRVGHGFARRIPPATLQYRRVPSSRTILIRRTALDFVAFPQCGETPSKGTDQHGRPASRRRGTGPDREHCQSPPLSDRDRRWNRPGRNRRRPASAPCTGGRLRPPPGDFITCGSLRRIHER